jgi:hypothetical protein
MVASNFENVPGTFEKKWRTEKLIEECAGSSLKVCGAAKALVARAMDRSGSRSRFIRERGEEEENRHLCNGQRHIFRP